MLRIASDFTQLALHALAHLRIVGALERPGDGYPEWSRAHLPESAWAGFEGEAAGCGRAPSAAALLRASPDLFADIAQLRASGGRPLAELGEHEVADRKLLAAFRERALAATTRWHAAAVGAGAAFAVVWHDELRRRCVEGLEAMRAPLARARALHPALAEATVELGWPLGLGGFASARRIVVGVPGDWGALGAALPAVVALHEAAVRAAAQARPERDDEERRVRASWAGLVDVARRVEDAPPPLRDAHASWLASRELEPLCRSAAALGLVAEERAQDVARHPEQRAEQLAACA